MLSRRLALSSLLLWPSLISAQGFNLTQIETHSGGLFASGLFSSLLEPTHVVTVRGLTSSKTAFTLRFLRDGRPESTIMQSSSAETLETRFVSRLQAGRSYRYPQMVIELLGVDTIVQLVRGMSGKPLESLRAEKPFRGVVLDQGFSETHYSIIIQEAGGSLRHLQGSFESESTRKVAELLSRGRSFEFPAVLEDALLTKEQRVERAKPENEATAVLNRYLGEWRGVIEGNPKAKITMLCHARPDGSGIWREITFSDGSEEVLPLPDINIVEYDKAAQVYLAGSLAEGSLPPLRSTWDEKTSTFTSILPADDHDIKRVNTATFTREDRIDWKTTTQTDNGEVQITSSGHYDRVRQLDDGEGDPWPPSAYSVFTPGGSSSNFAPPMQGFPPATPIKLSELSTCVPFRAQVISISLQDDEIQLGLRYHNGNSHTLTEKQPGIGRSENGQALAHLKQGEVYEFPFCIQHPGQPEAGKPTTPEMKALESLIGQWSMRKHDASGKLGEPVKQTIRYFWSADGASLWRDFFPPQQGTLKANAPTVPHFKMMPIHHLTYDSATRDYVEISQGGLLGNAPSRGTWDAAKQSYTWKGSLGSGPNMKADGVRTFVTPDRIEWKSRQLKDDGTVINESSGTYERIKD